MLRRVGLVVFALLAATASASAQSSAGVPFQAPATSYAPTLVWSGGTPTNATASAAYLRNGKLLFVRVNVYSGDALNGATGVTVSLPPGVTSVAGAGQYLVGSDVSAGAAFLLRAGGAATSLAGLFNPAGGLFAGRFYQASGVIEVQ